MGCTVEGRCTPAQRDCWSLDAISGTRSGYSHIYSPRSATIAERFATSDKPRTPDAAIYNVIRRLRSKMGRGSPPYLSRVHTKLLSGYSPQASGAEVRPVVLPAQTRLPHSV